MRNKNEVNTFKKQTPESERIKGETLYKMLVQTIPDVIYELDTKGKFTFVNEAVRQFGYTPEELIGKHFKEIIHPDDFEAVYRNCVLPKYKKRITGDKHSPKLFDERRTKERMTKYLEVRILLRGGDYCYCELHSSGKWDRDVKEKNKKFLGSFGIIRDITPRKHAEQVLEEREKQLRILTEKNADGIIIVDKNKVVRYVNPAAVVLFGDSREDLLGKVFTFPVIGNEKKEIKILHNDKVKTIIETHVAEIDWEGEVAYLISLRDITTRKQIEEELQQYQTHLEELVEVRTKELTAANKKLKKLDKLKSEFISIVSHELKTPISTIMGASENLLFESKLALETKKELIQIIYDESIRLTRLLNNLLEISCIESGKKKINKEFLNLKEMINSSCVELKEEAKKRDIKIVDMTADNIYIIADRDALYEILINLLSNAIKYSYEGGKVTISCVTSEKEAVITVEDQGIGISEDELSHIFTDKFYRSDRDEVRKIPGTGLGLNIVKNLVELQGGRVWAESELNKGSKFHFSLPLKEE